MTIFIDTNKFFADFLERYEVLSQKDDRLYEKYMKAESEGDTEKMKRLDRKMDMTCAKIDGLHEVLWMLGYTVKWQSDKFVIVHR